jgi:formylglycine-generating enzyme required for sulfatase activity/tRNA A-37 threonylcarbamoyl transferase component Bud32
MSTPSSIADRNLIFGLLALQMGFVTREQLLDGMNAWMLHKSTPIGEILRECGRLDGQKLELLEGLVEEHIAKCGSHLQATTDITPVASPLGDLPTTATGAGPSSSVRFRRLREHARGGVGEVFVALDEELDREVALKEIQARHADNPVNRARFLTEGRVTGALEHPGIVPVYGMGVYPDGRPYYAMRFVKGDSLKDAIATFHAPDRQGAPVAQRSLELRQLLRRFVDVCNAIAYAHSRGVIHRDIKPANVMLGKFGETLVVDWGLAKVSGQGDVEATESAMRLSPDSALTQAGRVLGTPAYMSPEQAAGKIEHVGPASDVYSLGATLYCLLTGKPPFTDGNIPIALANVQRGSFKPPRRVNASAPLALEAVCLKAMALVPEDRYPSPRELAEEIEHWLADEPVSAYREPLPSRAGRWVRRHPAMVAGSAALVFTVLLAGTIGGLLLGQEQRKTLREQQARLQQQRKAREAQVGTLLDVAPQAVPAVLEALGPYRDEVRPLLAEAVRKPELKPATPEAIRLWRQHRARAALGLLAKDPGQTAALTARLLEQDLDPAEMILVRDALKPHSAQLKSDLWRRANGDNPAVRFRALVALAAFDPDSPRWQEAARPALAQMLKADPLHLGKWVDALRLVKQHLLPLLERVFRGNEKKLAQYRQVAASVLADYAADSAETLVELIFDADPRQYAAIEPALMKHRTEAIARMRKELEARPDYWKDLPLDPKCKAAPAELVREIEQAGGIVAERFALCQALPLERVLEVTEGLRQSGYRPVRVRPWGKGTALVWARDDLDWALRTDLTAARVRDAPAGLIPADIAGYHTKHGDRYAVVWRKPGPGERAVVYARVPEAKYKAATDVFKNKGYLPATVHALLGTDGIARYSGVWWKGAEKGEKWHFSWGKAESAHDDAVFAGEHLLLDVHLGPARPSPTQLAWVAGLVAAPRSLAVLGLSQRYRAIASLAASPRHYASVWRDNTAREAKGLHGLSAQAHLARCRELIAQGYRPVALSLVALPGEKTPLAASAWHRPVPPEQERDRLATRQATAAATLLHLKEPEPVWPLLRHSPDPTVRSYLVERMGSRRVDARLLVERLDVEKDVSARRALIVALGEFTDEDLPAAVRGPLVKKLLGWYREAPDAGIHGAIDWLLRHDSEGRVERPLDWGCAKELERIDGELARASRERQGLQDDRRRWFVNGQGQTFTIIRGPVEFRMGSPLTEPEHSAVNEKPHRRVIPRNYAIVTKPVTVGQWQQFLRDRPDVPREFSKRYSPEPGGPIIAVSWFAAAQYCNWLSEKEGIGRDQWCYPETIEKGLKPYPDHLRRTGYRLPTEAEWEYACRAETTSSRYFGFSAELLGRYAWYLANSNERTWPVGQKRPNDLGLFDMHGNVWCWCQEAPSLYPSGRVEDKADIIYFQDKMTRVLRGESFDIKTPNVRSAYRGAFELGSRLNGIGVRVCRTYR